MSNPWPNNIFLQGFWQPWPAESDAHDLQVIGKIPVELNGTFFRNGPNPQYVHSERYYMFEGDGMIHAISFNAGKANYQNRWVRTERFLAERKAQKSLFGGMRDFMWCDESVKDCSRNTANTNIIWHHNKLLALNEGGPPIALETNDLRQASTYSFNQHLDRSMMAHPKIDPKSGELVFYSYLGPSMDFIYYVADAAGAIVQKKPLAMPYISLMHDFGLTENYCIFPLFPLIWDPRRLAEHKNIFSWQAELNTRFAIMPRGGNGDQLIWFEDAACLGMHIVNAYEQDECIILEMVVMDDIPANAVAFADDSITYRNYLTRWRFNLKTKTLVKQRLDDINVEFPRIDERYSGRAYKNAYMASTLNQQLPDYLFDSITHYDMSASTKRVHNFGADARALEPIFVPRHRAAAEGDGFVLTYVYRTGENRSDLVILDAKAIDAHPLAIVQLPHRVPYGFHGCWVEGLII